LRLQGFNKLKPTSLTDLREFTKVYKIDLFGKNNMELDWKIQSLRYSLDEIASNNDVVLVDSCSLGQVGDRLTTKLYGCHDELSIDPSHVEKQVEIASRLTSSLAANPNICTIKEVAAESEKHMQILNGQIGYHEKQLRTRKSGKRVCLYNERNSDRTGKITKKGKHFDYKPVSDVEEKNIEYLRIYADKLFELNRIFKGRIANLADENLLAAVKARVKNKQLKRDYSFRYPERKFQREASPENDTDERLVVTAAELAAKDKGAAIVSNDSDLLSILQSCYAKGGLFKVPEKGYVSLCVDYDDKGYEVIFSTTLLLI